MGKQFTTLRSSVCAFYSSLTEIQSRRFTMVQNRKKTQQKQPSNRKKSKIFDNPEETSFSIFSPGHFEKVETIWELNETTNEILGCMTVVSLGCPQKISIIYLLRFRRYMRPNK